MSERASPLARLLTWDARLSQWLRVAERPGPHRTLARAFAHSGDSWFWLAGLGLLWLVGDSDLRGLTARWIAAVLIAAAVVLAIKFSVRRPRPPGEWGEIYRRTDPHSFPSGHAARAALLVGLALASLPPAAALLIALWAPLVGLARVAMGVHYLSDVVSGWLVGALLAALLIPWLW